jgi:hypothetical protein
MTEFKVHLFWISPFTWWQERRAFNRRSCCKISGFIGSNEKLSDISFAISCL